MKKSVIAYSLLFVLLFSFSTILAQKPSEPNYTQIENNLLIGLKSDNQGLKLSSAYFLGEIQSKKATNQLMDLFHCSDNPDERQVVALALYKINAERGIFVIKRAIKFDEDAQTRRLCEVFYKQHQLRDRNGYVEVEPIMVSKLQVQYGDYKLIDFAL